MLLSASFDWDPEWHGIAQVLKLLLGVSDSIFFSLEIFKTYFFPFAEILIVIFHVGRLF